MRRFAIVLALVPMLWAGLSNTEQASAKKVDMDQLNEITVCESQAEFGTIDGTVTNFAASSSLTLDFLADVWVNENGFVCSYEKNYFYFQRDQILKDCKVTKTGITGSNAKIMEDEKVSIPIEILSQDSIKINGITAYRSNSETAKPFLAKMKELLKGDWIMVDNDGLQEAPFTVTDLKLKFMDPESNQETSCSYQFDQSALTITDMGNQNSYIRVQMVDSDCFILSETLTTVKIYRKDSKAYETYESKKDEFLVGTWIYSCNDRKKSEKWEITKDKITCTPFTKNAKSNVISYQIKRDGAETYLVLGDKKYEVQSFFDVIYLNTENEGTYSLLAYDSKEGKHELKNIQTIHKNGKLEKRSYAASVPDDFIKKARLTLTCKNNIILENAITFGSFYKELIDKSCLGCLLLSTDVKYKKAKLTMQYDAKSLGKVKESNLVVGYYKGSKIVLLKTKVNTKSHTVTAAYHGENQYFILDGAKYKKK